MPLSQLWSSLRCGKPFKRSPPAQPPVVSSQKDRTLSDTTESASSQTSALGHKDRHDLPTVDVQTQHTVTLSILDQGMPRHYTRFCLAFRLGETPASQAISRLEAFFRRTFQAQPWLAGYACPVEGDFPPEGKLEIRFSQQDVESFPVQVQELPEEKFPLTYDEFCELGMPPSKIPRELVSTCPERRSDTEPARILDVTVNIVRGGLLVAIFLHHGVTDGASMGTIISGQLCRGISDPSPPFTAVDLAEKAHAESSTRSPLSSMPPDQRVGTHLEYKPALRALGKFPQPPLGPTPTPAEVTSHIFLFSDSTLQSLKSCLNSLVKSSPEPSVPWLTTHDALQSLLWQHLTNARIPSLKASLSDRPLPDISTLLIPVNIRKRITPPLPPTYLGGAVALAPATVPLASLLHSTLDPQPNPARGTVMDDRFYGYLLPTAMTIHTTIARCDDTYLREVLALTSLQANVRSMVDLNTDTAAALDLCITSWAVLPIFEGAGEEGHGSGRDDGTARASDGTTTPAAGGTLGMGLGLPDYVRKPWSRDAGGCIILPRDRRRRDGGRGEPGLEVLVQLKTVDMERLMKDRRFMACVERVID
jgi:Transferase family